MKNKKIEEYLKRSLTREINTHYANIKSAFREILYKIPDSVLKDITNTRCPVVLIHAPVIASATSFYKKRNKFKFNKGIRIISINEKLNKDSIPIIVGVIIHELAHTYLHCITGESNTKKHEEEADNLLKQWGFEKEYLQARKFYNKNA